jgi:disulfide bond formation protein DsbB
MIGRLIYLSILLASALLLGLGMYFQYALRLESCGGQVLVRYALVLVALLALFAVAVNAGKLVRIVVSVGIGLAGLLGAGLAAHLSWPRHLPLDFTKLGVNVDALSRSLPLADVLPRFFLGTGDCGKARWTMIGIAASEWAFIAFLMCILAAAMAARRD